MENNIFVTKNLNLAAYFLSEGIEYIEAKNVDNSCVFYFVKDEKTMETLTKFRNDYWLKNYNLNRKQCLNIVRDIRNQC
jgi:hypothetical protein